MKSVPWFLIVWGFWFYSLRQPQFTWATWGCTRELFLIILTCQDQWKALECCGKEFYRWRAAVHGVAKGQTWPREWTTTKKTCRCSDRCISDSCPFSLIWSKRVPKSKGKRWLIDTWVPVYLIMGGGEWNPTWVPYNMGEMKPWREGPSCLPKGSWLGWGSSQVGPRSLSGENFGIVTGDTSEKKEKTVTIISLKPGGCLRRAFSSHVPLFPYNCLFCWSLASPFPNLLLISRLIHPSPFPFNFSHEVLE